jgi:hypothetical protein
VLTRGYADAAFLDIAFGGHIPTSGLAIGCDAARRSGAFFCYPFFVEWLIQVLTAIKPMIRLTAQEATNHKQGSETMVEFKTGTMFGESFSVATDYRNGECVVMSEWIGQTVETFTKAMGRAFDRTEETVSGTKYIWN